MITQFLNSLEPCQIEQAKAIAQYNKKAALRYCKIVAAKNKMQCPFCGNPLLRGGGRVYSLICSRYRRGKHQDYSFFEEV